MIASGARDETCAPMITPGTAPSSNDPVSPISNSPHSRCPMAAASTSGTACTRSVPTSSFDESVG